MKANKIILIMISAVAITAGCTKLDTVLKDSYTPVAGGTAGDPQSLLNNAYNDLTGLVVNQDQIFSLEECTSDEALVPTRGGDWDDNGVWRVLHAHTWDVTHTQATSVFLNLGKLESDATTVLASNPSVAQAAEATFLRSLAQFYLLDLYGQVPYRTIPKYNSIDAPPVLNESDAIDTITTNLTAIIPILSYAANSGTTLPAPYKASPDAARFLLMKLLLNKQSYLNRAAPAAQVAADMELVRTLGNAIVGTGKYQLTTHYFDNFGPNNGGAVPGTGWGASTEEIYALPNLPGVSSNNGIGSAGIDARWMMGLHYNSWDDPSKKLGIYGGAGWNGFSTVADFYNSFDASDTMRKGNVPYPGVTEVQGMRVGLLQGLQLYADGTGRVDRNGKPLTFNTTVSLVEPDPLTLEDNGVRIIKYAPDPAHYNSGQQANQLVIFRYADVLLMIAEADLSGASGGNVEALVLVNQLRGVRKADPLVSLTLVNSSNLYDPSTLLAERQKELYWESWRRQDLIRMGVYLQPWALKTADDPKYLLFPIPATQLVANPNLKQNPGY